MARQLYSVRFLAIQGLGGSSSSVTVPAGHVYVVRQLTFYSNPTFGVARGFFEDDTSGAALFAAAATPGTPFWAGFFGALVFEAGQGFHWHASVTPTDGIDVYAGGYDLTTP
jgi:hypothetical protein